VRSRIDMARFNSWDERIDAIEELVLDSLIGLSAASSAAAARPAASTAASAELAKVRAELKSTRAALNKVNRTRAMRLMRRYWAARRRAGRIARRLHLR